MHESFFEVCGVVGIDLGGRVRWVGNPIPVGGFTNTKKVG